VCDKSPGQSVALQRQHAPTAGGGRSGTEGASVPHPKPPLSPTDRHHHRPTHPLSLTHTFTDPHSLTDVLDTPTLTHTPSPTHPPYGGLVPPGARTCSTFRADENGAAAVWPTCGVAPPRQRHLEAPRRAAGRGRGGWKPHPSPEAQRPLGGPRRACKGLRACGGTLKAGGWPRARQRPPEALRRAVEREGRGVCGRA